MREALEELARWVRDQQAMPDDGYIAVKHTGLDALESLEEQLEAIRQAVRKPNAAITNKWYWEAVAEVERIVSSPAKERP